MTGWASGALCAFDIESTGVDVETARIVTACVARVGGGTEGYSKRFLADPGVEIPEAATAIHGVTTEHAREHGQSAADVAAEIESYLATAWATGLPVVGFNICYDLSLLDRELRRHRGQALTIGGPVIDPLVIDRHYDRYRRGPRKLDAMCAHYWVALDGAHDAQHDAVAAARLAWKQARTYPELAGMGLDELTAAQANWHAEWAEHLTAYRHGQGGTEVIDGAWPLKVRP